MQVITKNQKENLKNKTAPPIASGGVLLLKELDAEILKEAKENFMHIKGFLEADIEDMEDDFHTLYEDDEAGEEERRTARAAFNEVAENLKTVFKLFNKGFHNFTIKPNEKPFNFFEPEGNSKTDTEPEADAAEIEAKARRDAVYKKALKKARAQMIKNAGGPIPPEHAYGAEVRAHSLALEAVMAAFPKWAERVREAESFNRFKAEYDRKRLKRKPLPERMPDK